METKDIVTVHPGFIEKLREFYRSTLGLIIIIGAFTLVFMLYFIKIPPENIGAVNNVLGIVEGFAAAVVAFEFGSSRGSEKKTDVMAANNPAPTKSVTVSETTDKPV